MKKMSAVTFAVLFLGLFLSTSPAYAANGRIREHLQYDFWRGALFGPRQVPLNPALLFRSVRDSGIGYGALAIAISHAFSFFHNYLGSGEFRHASLAVLMTQPYARVVVLHVTILAGGLLAQAAGWPAGARRGVRASAAPGGGG